VRDSSVDACSLSGPEIQIKREGLGQFWPVYSGESCTCHPVSSRRQEASEGSAKRLEPIAGVRIPVSLWISSFTYVDLSTLNGIIEKIKDLQSVPPLKRAWTFVKDPEKIVGMRKEFDNVIGLFQVCIDLLSFIEKVLILCL
jgi:hypothetical protein